MINVKVHVEVLPELSNSRGGVGDGGLTEIRRVVQLADLEKNLNRFEKD